MACHMLRGYVALSQRTVGLLFVWNAKRMELISKENKYSALRFAFFDAGLILKVALGPLD